jgi:hypothetical protein
MGNALFPKDLLGALDGHAVVVEQLADSAQQQHVGRAVIAPPTGALHGFDLGEFAFPEPQDMGLNAQPVRDFADGAKGVGRFAHDTRSRLLLVAGGNTVLHEVGRAEGQDAAGLDRNFFAGLGVSANAGRLVTHAESAEGRDLDLFAPYQRVGHVFQHALDQLRTFVAGEADFAKDGFAQIHACQSLLTHNFPLCCFGSA